jgi:hypothetical protein
VNSEYTKKAKSTILTKPTRLVADKNGALPLKSPKMIQNGSTKGIINSYSLFGCYSNLKITGAISGVRAKAHSVFSSLEIHI